MDDLPSVFETPTPDRRDTMTALAELRRMGRDFVRLQHLQARGPEIVAVSPEPDALDDLAGRATVLADAGDLTVLPAFSDAHEHLMEASRNTLLVPVDGARSIAEFTAMPLG